jgi:hypothetical protein
VSRFHLIIGLCRDWRKSAVSNGSAAALTVSRRDVKIIFTDGDMNDHELHRVVQYVTARTSYGREMVADILRTGLGELSTLAADSTRPFEREALLEYISQWTIKRTGQPEPLVREVLGCAGRWLDEAYDELAKRQPEALGLASNDEGDPEVA